MTKSIIYPSFWKPQLIAGVTRYYITLCGALGVGIYFFGAIFLGFNPIVSMIAGAIVGGIAWVYGFIRSKTDAEFFDVYVVKLLTFDAHDSTNGNRYHP